MQVPVIAAERPDTPEVARLVQASLAFAEALYPAESNHGLAAEALAAPGVFFLVARLDGYAVGCGALVAAPDGVGELKAMWVEPERRGRGIARAVLARLEQEARARGMTRLVLETGVLQPEAISLYRRHGFVETGPFGDYGPDPLSVFMAKTLHGVG